MTPTPRALDVSTRAHRVSRTAVVGLLAVFWSLACPSAAHASFLSPELEDKMAGFLAIFVLFVVPVVLIVLFWMVHVMPEKIAHKRHHPQLDAIRTLCLLSLAFGGLLWPLAWLWAYTKPVGYKLAYGTDKHPDYFKEHGLPEAGKPRRRHRVNAWPRSKRAVCLPVSSTPFGPIWQRSSRGWLQVTARARWANGNPAAWYLLLLCLADLHQAEAAALDDSVEGRRRNLPGGGLAAIILMLNIFAPTTKDVRVVNYVVPIVSQVRGRVIEVAVDNNRPVKKGDVLFRIDPTPYESDVHSLEAQLASAEAKVGADRPELNESAGAPAGRGRRANA